jgi:cholesterol transport system auxiliary component
MNGSCRLAPPIAVLVAVTVLNGCAPKKSYPERRYYVFDISRPEEAFSPPHDAVLSVRRFRVSPRYEGKGFVYRDGDLSYQSDFYNEFLISPGSLLTEEVRQWLVSSDLFQHVVDSSSHMEAAYFLEGNVTALYGDYREVASPTAVLDIQFFLINDVSARSEVVFQKEYREAVSLDGPSAKALVNGWNTALRQILTALEQDLRAVDLAHGQ